MEGNPVPLQQGLQLQTVKISVVGNFYSLLRWLRQAERDGCKFKRAALAKRHAGKRSAENGYLTGIAYHKLIHQITPTLILS